MICFAKYLFSIAFLPKKTPPKKYLPIAKWPSLLGLYHIFKVDFELFSILGEYALSSDTMPKFEILELRTAHRVCDC